jgi:bacterioferritin-associated ferredoxin
MQVTRCICQKVTFDEMKMFIDQSGADLDQLQDEYGCGLVCGLCTPYICRMLETGETSFPFVLPKSTTDSGLGA